MTAYTATFTNGRTLALKNSKREYSHAYLWIGADGTGRRQNGKGFARTRELAQKAMSREQGWVLRPPAMGRGDARYIAYMRKLIAEWKPGQVTFAEIVPVVRGEG
jgi:hypothetical protein